MSKFQIELEKLISEDPLGLLKLTSKKSTVLTTDQRLVSSFQEINDFYDKYKREPMKTTNTQERKLFSRLLGVREDHVKAESLREYDTHGLLKDVNDPMEVIDSVDDAINSDPLGILGGDDGDIFNFKNVPKGSIEMPDRVARRKPCNNFNKYEILFKQCHNDLVEGKRKLRPFIKEQQIAKGMFFILKGIMVFVAGVGEKKIKKGRVNARLKCIFENGTESNMLLRSLASELYKDGRRVTEQDEKLLDGFNNINDEDTESGFIYVLKSKRNHPEIQEIKHLYKIGFTKKTTDFRVKSAKKDPTYLMGDVEIVADYQCYNMNTKKFEEIVHKFFHEVCLDAEIIDSVGALFKPKEWFIVPFDIIEQAIHYIINGKIVNLKYDPVKQEIVNRK